MPGTLTVLTAVNTWECDENDHMNVQFYAQKFDTALAAMGQEIGTQRFRLLRYHRELRAGEAIRVLSQPVTLADGRNALCHRMDVTDDGALSATALDIGLGAGGPLPPESALPRGGIDDAENLEADDGAEITYRGIIAAADLTPQGRISSKALVGCFSDAAPAAWTLAGMSTTWLKARNLGRVAMEMSLSFGTPPQAGDTVTVHTSMVSRAEKTKTYRHRMTNDRTGAVVVVGRATSLAISYDDRRAIVIPEDARAAIDARLRRL